MWSFFSRDPSKDFNFEIGEVASNLDKKSVWSLHKGKRKVRPRDPDDCQRLNYVSVSGFQRGGVRVRVRHQEWLRNAAGGGQGVREATEDAATSERSHLPGQPRIR